MVRASRVLQTISKMYKTCTHKAEVPISKLIKTGITRKQWINYTTSVTKIAFSCSSKTRMFTGNEQKLTRTWFNTTKRWTMVKLAECLGAPATPTRWKHPAHSLDSILHRHNITASPTMPKNEWIKTSYLSNNYINGNSNFFQAHEINWAQGILSYIDRSFTFH